MDNSDLEEFDDETEEDSDEVTVTLSRELAEKLHEVLMGVLSNDSEEGEEAEESEEFEGEEAEEGEELKAEAVEAEVKGHALVDAEKLNCGLTNHSSEVKGAVPVTKKTAETPHTGKDSDGKLKPHATEPAVKKLQSKKQDVGGVHVGKTLFDN
jgi:hypothetical protein